MRTNFHIVGLCHSKILSMRGVAGDVRDVDVFYEFFVWALVIVSEVGKLEDWVFQSLFTGIQILTVKDSAWARNRAECSWRGIKEGAYHPPLAETFPHLTIDLYFLNKPGHDMAWPCRLAIAIHWLNGDFVFGDFLLVRQERSTQPRRHYIFQRRGEPDTLTPTVSCVSIPWATNWRSDFL